MRKLTRLGLPPVLALAAVTWLVMPAEAKKPALPPNAPKHCAPHRAAFDVKGSVTGGSLTRDAGNKKAYSGTLDVTVTRTNKLSRAYLGRQSFTLAHVRLSFEHGVDTASPAGSLAHLQGKINVAPRRCPAATGYTINKVELKKAKPAKKPTPPQKSNPQKPNPAQKP